MSECESQELKMPKNIRQVGDRDQFVKLYVEDYVNTYLKRLYPTGGQDLRVGLLLGEIRSQDGIPCLFADGAMEMEQVTREGERVEFTEEAWKRAYQVMEQKFPRRSILGWFLCGAPGCTLSPLNYWKQHGRYFSGKNQLMFLNSGLEGDEAIYVASQDGFYKLRGYSIYYERNQMMQDYMVSRKEAHRVESGTRDTVIQDFRQKLEENRQQKGRARKTVHALGTACGVLGVIVLAGGVAMGNSYQKMQALETALSEALPKEAADALGGGDEVQIEHLSGQLEPGTLVIRQDDAGQETEHLSQEETKPAASDFGTADGGADVLEAGAAPDTEQETERDTEQETEPETQTVSVPEEAVLYTVQSGETLYGICMERYHSMADIAQICQWNGLENENQIFAGQRLYLPPWEERS